MVVNRRGNKQINNLDGTMRLGLGRRNMKVTKEGVPALNPDIYEYILRNQDGILRYIDNGIASIPGGSVGANSTVEFAATLIPYENLPFPPLVLAQYTEGADGLNNFGGVRLINPVDTGTSFEFRQIIEYSIGVIPSSATAGDIKIYATVQNANSSSYSYTGAEVVYKVLAESADV